MARHHRSVEAEARQACYGRDQPVNDSHVTEHHRPPVTTLTPSWRVHACAQRLLDQGLSFKEIGDHLGHRSPTTTAVYAKVDLAGLRQVADIDLEWLI